MPAWVSATSTSTVRPASSKRTRPRLASPLSGEVVLVRGWSSWCGWGHGWASQQVRSRAQTDVGALAGAAYPFGWCLRITCHSRNVHPPCTLRTRRRRLWYHVVRPITQTSALVAIWNTAAEINTNTDGAIWLASGRCSLPRRYQAFHRAGLRDSQVSDAAVSRIPPVSSPLAVGLARLP